ncbi:MAG: hypothetical protein GX410_02590 [Elusimicrobia bacterium]|nr:hypothetical protein [Elusimicrobiota bacterium]
MKRVARVLCIGLLASAAALALLEAGIRAAGFFARGGPSGKGGSRTVLCVGDSFVWGVGGKSFPEQLGEKLASDGGVPYEVVNAGAAGYNSAQVLGQLPGLLARYRPAFVIALVGANNSWNTLGSSSCWFWQGILSRAAAYRFFAYLFSNPPALAQGRQFVCSLPSEPDRLPLAAAVAAASPLPPCRHVQSPSRELSGLYARQSSLFSEYGDFGRAVRSGEAAVCADSSSPEAAAALARAELGAGNPNKALEALAPVSPDTAKGEVLLAYGDCMAALKEHDKAVEFFKRSIAEGGGHSGKWKRLAFSYWKSGRYSQAAAACRQGLALYPGSGELLGLLMQVEVWGGRGSAAWKLLNRSLDEGWAETGIMEFFGTLMATGDYSQARSLADRLFKLRGERRQYAFLGEALVLSGRYAAALDALGKAPPDCGAYCSLSRAQAYAGLGRDKEAAAEYAGAEEDWHALLGLAALQGCGGDYEEALVLCDKAFKLSGGDVRAVIQRARLLSARGSASAAFEQYVLAVRLAPYSRQLVREALSCGMPRAAQKLAEAVPQVRANRAFSEAASNARDTDSVDTETDVLVRRANSEIQKGLGRDIQRIAALCRERGARLIVSSYPEWEFPSAKEAALAGGAQYMDFTGLFASGFPSRSAYISYDNSHCNTFGYGVMASEFAAKIRELEPK